MAKPHRARLTKAAKALVRLRELNVPEAFGAAVELLGYGTHHRSLLELLAVVGMTDLLALSVALGGRKVTIPTAPKLLRATEICQAILEVKLGHSIHETAKKFKIHERDLQKAIARYDEGRDSSWGAHPHGSNGKGGA